ncbi:MAG: trimethylamine methyltransferase family protein [Bacillota bacterium]|nr:trimethylamine methyltransferase family protein [Bacillota bacterium]MDW7730073.1 trimethylamine methyltransferase family protein [Bacillota bacterium]
MYWEKCSSSNQFDNGSVRFSVFSQDQCARVFRAILEVLERTGARIYNEEALELLRNAGCRIDGERVWIPSRLVEKAIESAPSRLALADRNGKRRLFLEGRNTYFGPGPTNPNFIDLDSGERRKVTKQDVRNVARLVDALPSLDFCMSLACISDVTPVLADVHEVQAMLENTSKPIVSWAFNLNNNASIVALCEAAAGGAALLRDNPFFVLYTEPATPLKHPKESLDKLLFMAEKELPVIYTPGVQGNATAPSSLAGVIVMAASDCLAGLVIHQLKNPGAPFIAGGVTTNMDMRTMIHCYASSPDFCLMHAGYSELVQYLGLPMFSTAGASDSKALDMQTAIEYSLSIYTAALSGANLVHDVGFLESGMSASLQGLVMGDEIISYVRKMIAGIRVDDETLAVDVIDAVGPGGHFLQEDHTYRNFKTAFWLPRLMNREQYPAWEAGGRLTYDQRLTEKTRQLLAEHQPESLDHSIVSEFQKIIDMAEGGRVA